jgi:hypothetical protein
MLDEDEYVLVMSKHGTNEEGSKVEIREDCERKI